MDDDELEAAHRSELSKMVRYWRDRAIQYEQYLNYVNEIPEVAIFLQEKMKCESEIAEIKCSSCNCWKSEQKEETGEP